MQGPHFPCPRGAMAGESICVTATGTVVIPIEEMPALRKAPGPADGPTVPGSLLRHADDHTVLAMSAVLQALATREPAAPEDAPNADWGVIVAPRYPGRLAVSSHLDRFLQQGPSGVSPLIIPTMSLHAAAGSVSLGLGLHGPSNGVGGGPGNLGQALLAGLAVIKTDPLVPGLWIVATGWSPEAVPGPKGKPVHPATGYAVALGLHRSAPGAPLRLTVELDATTGFDPDAEPGQLAKLASWLEGPRSEDWSLAVEGGLLLRLLASRVGMVASVEPGGLASRRAG